MRYCRVVLTSLMCVGACGDNLGFKRDDAAVDGSAQDTANDVDAGEDAQGPLGDSDPCPDTVVTIMTGNPGNDPNSYPAAGWYTDDTRSNGAVFVDDTIPPPTGFGCRSARLVTGAMTAPSPSQDKAQLITFALAGTNLSSITTISYYAYRSSASTGGPAIDLALNVSLTGTGVPGNYMQLVYEPYQQSGSNGAILQDTWQQWDATATTAGDGVWWTSKITNPNPGSQSMPIPWATFQATYPDAKILGYGFNVGSFNPNMILAGDGLVFGTTATDF